MTEFKTYHPYVFDAEGGHFVGRFDEMYRAEQQHGFDSWHQDDLANLTKRICLEVLSGLEFGSVLDIGTGKGAFTERLRKAGRRVVGIDISDTALSVARVRCPDATFICADLGQPGAGLEAAAGGGFDVVICLETLSYLANWDDMIAQMASVGRHGLVALYLPPDPRGFVKSFDALVASFERSFRIIEDIRLLSRRQVILFGESIATGQK